MRLRFVLLLVLSAAAAPAAGQSVSAPAILQYFEARWDTIEDRMADIHAAGYGRLWLPPPARADSGGFSVGYDVFDRFDLGTPRNETLYGTETSFSTMVDAANNAGVDVYTDLIINHNGFGNRLDANFVAAGGYPGFALTLPQDIDGDFHDPFASGVIEGQLSGLNDIAQEKNNQFIRHPTQAGNPDNIPAGTVFNQPLATNTRFYPDQQLGGTQVFDPELNQNVTLYDFNFDDPSAGDPVLENAVGLLQRNVRWMIQKFGVKGFRVDAAKHVPEFTLDFLDQAIYRAITDLQHDGSIQPAYMFQEILDGDKGLLQSYTRLDLPNRVAIQQNETTVAGNRDVIDFPLFFALRDNLTGNGLANNWHDIRGASQDANDRPLGAPEWHTDGSQGVAFVASHDDNGAFLENVAHAYVLMRPGNAIVYLNAVEFGTGRDFPKDGKVDALGGVFGDTVTKLVGLRNSHGRGDFIERWIDGAFDPEGFSNVYVYEREDSAVVGLNSRNDSFIETRTVQTAFAPGTVLVELTGNATDGAVDPTDQIADTVRVDANGQIPISIPGNAGHGRGYVIYGVSAPQGAMTIDGASSVLAGATQTGSTFGTARLEDIDVVTSNTFTVRLNTTPVTLAAPVGEANAVRDVHADGDTALLKINDGIDLNGNSTVDVTAPGDVAYGFEQFTDTRTPGYIWDGSSNVGTGAGLYEQVIDTTQLDEGRNYVTVRAFRHRDASTGGDGGPAVFTDFTRTIYVDLLPPDSAIASFDPFASDPNNPNNRDLVLESVDQTANSVHYFFDEPAATSDAALISRAQQGEGATGDYDRNQWVAGITDVTTGNHTVTIVSFEPTGNVNVQRFAGVFTQTNIGLGAGDLSGDGVFRVDDLTGAGGLQEVLLSNNTLFNASADADGNGLVDNRDLFALQTVFQTQAIDPRVFPAFEEVLEARADFDGSGAATVADLAMIYANLGGSDWLLDLDVDGVVTLADAEVFVTQLLRTSPADFNLDGVVDGSDYAAWRNNLQGVGAGDANFDGVVNNADLALWQADFGAARTPLGPIAAAASAAAPEASSLVISVSGLLVLGAGRIAR
ncbi:MAG: hypothetical protein AAF589_01175 [Planctomycetota bacterium]